MPLSYLNFLGNVRTITDVNDLLLKGFLNLVQLFLMEWDGEGRFAGEVKTYSFLIYGSYPVIPLVQVSVVTLQVLRALRKKNLLVSHTHVPY